MESARTANLPFFCSKLDKIKIFSTMYLILKNVSKANNLSLTAALSTTREHSTHLPRLLLVGNLPFNIDYSILPHCNIVTMIILSYHILTLIILSHCVSTIILWYEFIKESSYGMSAGWRWPTRPSTPSSTSRWTQSKKLLSFI